MVNEASTERLIIAFKEEGPSDGPGVVLLHGWPDDATTWNGVIPALVADENRFVTPWLRGFGNTRFKQESEAKIGNSDIHAYDLIAR